jgi:Holliday junction resolvasome RuvABC DNA-binding subunit
MAIVSFPKNIIAQAIYTKSNKHPLQSIPGIGEITAWDILAEMPDVVTFSP